MRQLIVGKTYASGVTLTGLNPYEVAFYYLNNGVYTLSTTGTDFKNGVLFGGVPDSTDPAICINVSKNNFSYVKAEYVAGQDFEENVTCTSTIVEGTYGFMLVKKGVPFNERNKYTISHYVSKGKVATTSQQDIIDVFEKQLKNVPDIEVTKTGVTLNIKGKDNQDYEVLTFDSQVTSTNVTHAEPALCDYKDVLNMWNKSLADRGIEYTYDLNNLMYPKYLQYIPMNAGGYTVFTLRFAEPNAVRPFSQDINQVVQVVFQTGDPGISAFETVCQGLAG